MNHQTGTRNRTTAPFPFHLVFIVLHLVYFILLYFYCLITILYTTASSGAAGTRVYCIVTAVGKLKYRYKKEIRQND